MLIAFLVSHGLMKHAVRLSSSCLGELLNHGVLNTQIQNGLVEQRTAISKVRSLQRLRIGSGRRRFLGY